MRLFTITIGPRGAPRHAFEVSAPDAFTAHEQHVDLAEPGERFEVAPVPTEEELLAADVAANVDKARKAHARNDAAAVEAQRVYFRALGVA